MRQRRRIVRRIVWRARGEVSVTRCCPQRAMGANRCPTPRTRSRMRWERRLYGMNQHRQGHPVHQGRLLSHWLLLVPLPSRIFFATLPPLVNSSTFFALPSSGRSLRHPLRCSSAAQTRRSNLLPRITQRLFLSRHHSTRSLPSSVRINYEGFYDLSLRVCGIALSDFQTNLIVAKNGENFIFRPTNLKRYMFISLEKKINAAVSLICDRELGFCLFRHNK